MISAIVLFMLLGALIVYFVLAYKRKQELHNTEMIITKNNFENQLLQSRIETQEETLAVLGKELHDNIGQLLNSTKLLIGVTQRKLIDAPDTLTIADETLATAISELRSLSKSLNKEWLQQFNFIENLQTEIKRINASEILQINCSNSSKIPFPSDAQIILFRIVQEALQNAIKHARASHIDITITEDQNSLLLLITDNGTGFDFNDSKKNSLGLLNMQHRTKLLGGSIEWASTNSGTSVTLRLPLLNETI
ncbi:MAG: hypothetical protein K2Q21_01125 [Chitinophagaceae bacterium]|nr:hypothetical protein [Chitinophagaceae bacterium]